MPPTTLESPRSRTGSRASGTAAKAAAAPSAAGVRTEPAVARAPVASAVAAGQPAAAGLEHTAFIHPLADTLGEQVTLAARRRLAPVAYIEGEERYTWPEVDLAADHLACGLLALGLKRGDRVGVLAPNQIEWLVLFYAAARVGVAVVGLSVRHRDSDLAHMLGDSGAKVVFTVRQHDGHDCIAMLRRLQPQLPHLRHVITIGGEGLCSYASLAATPVDVARLALARRQVQPHDLAMVIYTSGTTGRPKGAGLTHRGLLASAAGQAAHLRITDADVVHLSNPLHHVGAIACGVLAHLVGGGSVVILPEFKAERMLALMARHRPTLVGGVPTVLMQLLSHPNVNRVDWSGVRVVYTGGACADEALMDRLAERMPKAMRMHVYGLSETSGAVVMTHWNATRDEQLHAIGKVFEGWRVRVTDGAGRALPPGEVGELWIQGPSVVPGYIGAAAGQGFSMDGWLMTGDLGSIDARGVITLKGRKKDMYTQGGFNVYPAEIESLLTRHPKVLMAAVIGVPDPMLGEVGRLYVVPRPDSGLKDAEIRRWCAEQLADYKLPREVELRPTLPMTPAGKICKAALRGEASVH